MPVARSLPLPLGWIHPSIHPWVRVGVCMLAIRLRPSHPSLRVYAPGLRMVRPHAIRLFVHAVFVLGCVIHLTAYVQCIHPSLFPWMQASSWHACMSFIHSSIRPHVFRLHMHAFPPCIHSCLFLLVCMVVPVFATTRVCIHTLVVHTT